MTTIHDPTMLQPNDPHEPPWPPMAAAGTGTLQQLRGRVAAPQQQRGTQLLRQGLGEDAQRPQPKQGNKRVYTTLVNHISKKWLSKNMFIKSINQPLRKM